MRPRTLLLLCGLLERGLVAELICQPGSPLEERARQAGVRVHPVAMHGEFDPVAIHRIRRIMRHRDFEICQMHTSHAHFLGVFARGFRRLPKTVFSPNYLGPVA